MYLLANVSLLGGSRKKRNSPFHSSGSQMQSLTLSLPESIMGTCGVVLSFESVDKILWCDHSNSLFSSNFACCHLFFNILQNAIWQFSQILFLVLLGVKRKLRSSLIAMRGGSVCRLRKIMLESFHWDYKGDS